MKTTVPARTDFIDLPLEERIEAIIDAMDEIGLLALDDLLDQRANAIQIARAMFDLGIKLGFIAGHEDGHVCVNRGADPEPPRPMPGYL